MIKINCDIGERGAGHPIDMQLMRYIQIANIACGGHAGDDQSITVFRRLARDNNLTVTAHLSYPDPENFGRLSMDIAWTDLEKSLDQQINRMPEVTAVKFHGALYNDSVSRNDLAENLAQWATKRDIATIIAPGDSAMADQCRKRRIVVMAEAFAERRYTINALTGRLQLVPRQKEYACIHDCETAVEQTRSIAVDRLVETVVEIQGGGLIYKAATITADTICIHSDSPIALELAAALAALN